MLKRLSLSQALRYVKSHPPPALCCSNSICAAGLSSQCQSDGSRKTRNNTVRPRRLNTPKVFLSGSKLDDQPAARSRQSRHGFHTIAPLAVPQGHRVHNPTAKPPNRPPPPSPPAANTSLPPAPVVPSRIGVSTGRPALGNRRKAGSSSDDKRPAPHNPSQEMQRQKDLEEAFFRLQGHIAKATLRLDRLHQELAAWKEHNVIGQELHLARKAARQQYIQDLAVTRANDLVMPLDNRLSRISHNVDTLRRHFAGECELMRTYRRRLVADIEETVAQMTDMHQEDSVDVLLQESGHLFSDLTRLGLSPSDLIGICEGLQTRGLWEMNEEVRFWREYSPMGGKTPNVKLALTKIIDLRPKLDINAVAISLEVHHLRKIRRNRMSYERHPELFQYLLHDLKFYLALNRIANTANAIFHEARNFGFWVHSSFPVKTSRNVFRKWSDLRLWLLIQKVARGASTLKAHYWDHLRGLKVFAIDSTSSDLPLQLARVSDFGPFTVCQQNFNDILKLVIDFKDEMEGFRKFNPQFKAEVDQRPALNLFLENREWQWKATHHVRSRFWRDLEAAIHWKAAADLCLGFVPRPVSRSLMRVPENLTSVDRGPKASHVPVAGFIDHRLPLSGCLYPQGPSVPVKYITSSVRASTVIQDLSKTRVIALDLVMKDAPEARAVSSSKGASRTSLTSARLPIDFVVMTTETEVAIFHIGYLGPMEVISTGLFEPILENESILKVGFNIEHQKRLLSKYLCHRLIQYHDLRLQPQRHIATAQSPIDASWTTKASGAYSQKSDLAKGLRTAYQNPSLFFHNLASTGYAALKMYAAACRARDTGAASAAESQGQIPSPNLGPVLIYADTSSPARATYRELNLPYVERKKILLGLARGMAKTMYEDTLHAKDLPWLAKSLPASVRQAYVEEDGDLHAYVLFTSFHENLETIAGYLEVDDAVSRILVAAERYQLPLLDIDRKYLSTLRGFGSAPSTENEVAQILKIRTKKKSRKRRRRKPGGLPDESEVEIYEALDEKASLPEEMFQMEAVPPKVSSAESDVSKALTKEVERLKEVAHGGSDDVKISPKDKKAAHASPKERKKRLSVMSDTSRAIRFSPSSTTVLSTKRRTAVKTTVMSVATAKSASPDLAENKTPSSVLFSPLWTKAKHDAPRESPDKGLEASSANKTGAHKVRKRARKASGQRHVGTSTQAASSKRSTRWDSTSTKQSQSLHPPYKTLR
ncbi:hypothetical protein H2204_004320 [Knufia peltigerae]|uniref:3'-5' exonuclease domain-containing protein n=1 Tax=Knufia peltigerae TaxID=1002370 RepID=A0AA38Y937_9EURO|nr:hypothetical protein H2204_004320 [Knufia peltigerae]